MKTTTLLFLILLLAGPQITRAAAGHYDLVVAKDGGGNYTTVQDAINAAPEASTQPFRIYIKNGWYFGQVIIPDSKPFIELVGESVAGTIIAWGDGKGGTSAVIINASDCMLMNLTLQNTQGIISDGPQSLAIKVNSDRVVLFNCRFISGQDTVLANRSGNRIYFSNCYIDGNTDFIYGASIAVFDHCVIYPRDRVDRSKGGYITAASTPEGQTYGLVFRDCSIPDNHGFTNYTLGRPWQNDYRTEADGRKRANNKVVFLNTVMGASIRPEGWSIWDTGTKTDVILYAEYKTKRPDGTAADIRKRVPWARQLSDAEAALYYNNANLFGQWDPFSTWKDLSPNTWTPEPTITNFIARDIDDENILQFNASWPINGVTYTLYKSADRQSFKEYAHITPKPGNQVSFQFNDKLPGNGENIYYLVKAASGGRTALSDTLVVNPGNINRPKSR
ncbi:MAG TPA: pectinesterase family protein [Chitinophagaceae bacterium]|jgi:pectin methylesterase-like acyl-CoA thioesterase